MPFHFERQHPNSKLTRGLTSDALDSFSTAYIGGIEFGHYFRVSRPGDAEMWRWTVLFPVSGEVTGMSGSESEVREKLETLYESMLQATGLRAPKTRPKVRRSIHNV